MHLQDELDGVPIARIHKLRLENLLVVGADLDVDRLVRGEPKGQRKNKRNHSGEGTRKHVGVLSWPTRLPAFIYRGMCGVCPCMSFVLRQTRGERRAIHGLCKGPL